MTRPIPLTSTLPSTACGPLALHVLQVLLDPILPVFAIMAFGFAMGRMGKASVDDARFLNRFALTILLPILVFGLIANAQIPRFDILPLAIYAGVQVVVFTVGLLLALTVLNRPAGEAVLLGFCGVFVNTVMYILPISVLLYGEGRVLPAATIVTWDSTVTFASAMIALQMISLGRVSFSQIALTIAKTPILQAIAAGVVVSMAEIAIPAPLETFIQFAGGAAAPVALYALGVALSKTDFRPNATVASFVGIKLFVFPAAIWLAMDQLAAEAEGGDLYRLISAGPSGAMAFSLALLYNIRTDAIAQIIVWTSLLTLVSLALLA